MWEEVLNYLSVYLLSMFKFIFGPVLGFASNFKFSESVLVTVGGMMTSVLIFTYLGEQLREKFLKRFYKPKKESSKNLRILKIWKRYGTFGVCFLTPLIFSPIGGTLILITLGSPRKRIIVFMFISAVFWSVVLCYLIYFLGYQLR